MQQIRTYFETEYDISASDWEIFSSRLIRQEFAKKTDILHEGQVEDYLSFLETGIIRLYIPGIDHDLTFGFAFPGSFFSAYDSFLQRSPSAYSIESITDSVLWRVTYDDLQEIYQQSMIGDLIGRRASEELFVYKSQREISLLRDSAEVRYLQLLEQRPELIQHIPLQYIASYIGITPQALSRIRRRIAERR